MTIAADPSIGSDALRDPFRYTYAKYRENGWLGTIPIPKGKKHPPPNGATGGNAVPPDDTKIGAWLDMPRYLNANIALRLGEMPGGRFEVIGIDIDDYGDKNGGKQLAELESEYGALPPTWVSSSRSAPSGIRFFLVPVGFSFIGKAAPAIEIIQRVHRYAMVWPSLNPDSRAQYRWIDPNGAIVRDLTDIPSVDELPALPDGWLQFLTRGGMRDLGPTPIDMDATNDEVSAWIDQAMSSCGSGLCDRMERAVEGWSQAIELGESSHDKIVSAHWELARLAVEGHHGLQEAMQRVSDTFVRVTLQRGKRSVDEVRREVGRSFWGALRRIKGELGGSGLGPFRAPSDTCPPDRDTSTTHSASRPLAGVTPTTVRWLWKGWLPIGKVSMLEGDPDVGKSSVTIDWSATVSTGRQWPLTSIGDKILTSRSDPAGVLLVGAEDGYEDTVVPRLIASGADLNRVHALNRPFDRAGKPMPFTIPADINWLRQAVDESAARLVIIDPITACLPENTRHGVDAEIRRILQHLSDLAAEADCAIVLIRHFNKASGMSAKHRGGGSIAYTAVVRSVLSVAVLREPGPQEETHAIARAKGNLSSAPKAIGFRLVRALDVPDLPEPEDEELGVSVVRWGGPLEMNADQLVGADSVRATDARKYAPSRDECERLLREILADGPMKVDTVRTKVREAAGCSAKPVNDAATAIGIVKKVVRIKGRVDHWTWELPPLKTKLDRTGVEAE